MTSSEIKNFAETGQFSPVFSANQKGTITIAGDAILDVSNLKLVGNRIVLQSEEERSPSITSIGEFSIAANSIELNSGNIKAQSVNLNTNNDENTKNGQIVLNGANFDTSNVQLNSQNIYLGNSELKNGEEDFATLIANADQISLNGTFVAGNSTLNAKNIFSSNNANFTSNGDLTLEASEGISLDSSVLNATNLKFLTTNYIALNTVSLNSDNLTLQTTGENSLINVSDSNLEAENAFELSADQAKISGGILTSKGETTKINVNDKIAFENNQLDISNSATITAGNQITFSNSTLNNQNENSTLTLSATNENGVISINESDFSLNSFTLNNTNQASISGSTIDANSLDFDLNDKIIVSGSTFDNVSNLDWNAKNYISLNGSEFNFTGSNTNTQTFTANQTKISNTQMQDANNLKFSGSGEDSIIEVEQSENESITSNEKISFDADYLDITGGTLKASDLNLEGKQITITGGEFEGTTITLSGDELVSINGENVQIGLDDTTTLTLKSENLIELKQGVLNAKTIEITASKGVDISGGNLGSENSNITLTTEGLFDVTGGTIQASDLEATAGAIDFKNANLKASGSVTFEAMHSINISQDDEQSTEINAGTLNLQGSNENNNFTITLGNGTLNASELNVNADQINIEGANLTGENIKLEAQRIIADSGSVDITGSAYLFATNLVQLGKTDFVLDANDIYINAGEEISEFNGATSALVSLENVELNADNNNIDIYGLNIILQGQNTLQGQSITLDAQDQIQITQTNLTATELTLNGENLIQITNTQTSGGETSETQTNSVNINVNEAEFSSENKLEFTNLNLNSEGLKFKANQIDFEGGEIIATGNLEILATKGNESGVGGILNLNNITLEANELSLQARNDISVDNSELLASKVDLLANNYIEISNSDIVSTAFTLQGLNEESILKEIKMDTSNFYNINEDNSIDYAENIDFKASHINIGNSYLLANTINLLSNNVIEIDGAKISSMNLYLKGINDEELLEYAEISNSLVSLYGDAENKGVWEIDAGKIKLSNSINENDYFDFYNMTINLKASDQIWLQDFYAYVNSSYISLEAQNQITLKNSNFLIDETIGEDTGSTVTLTAQAEDGVIFVQNSNFDSFETVEAQGGVIDFEATDITANELSLNAKDKLLMQDGDAIINNNISLDASSGVLLDGAGLGFLGEGEEGQGFTISTDGLISMKDATLDLYAGNLNLEANQISITDGTTMYLENDVTEFFASDWINIEKAYIFLKNDLTFEANNKIYLSALELEGKGEYVATGTSNVNFITSSFYAEGRIETEEGSYEGSRNSIKILGTLDIQADTVVFNGINDQFDTSNFNITASDRIWVFGDTSTFSASESLKWLAQNYIEIQGGESEYEYAKFNFSGEGEYIFSAQYQDYQNVSFSGTSEALPNVSFGFYDEENANLGQAEYIKLGNSNNVILSNLGNLALKAKGLEFGAQMEGVSQLNMEVPNLTFDNTTFQGVDDLVISGNDSLTFNNVTFVDLVSIDLIETNFVTINGLTLKNSETDTTTITAQNFILSGKFNLSNGALSLVANNSIEANSLEATSGNLSFDGGKQITIQDSDLGGNLSFQTSQASSDDVTQDGLIELINTNVDASEFSVSNANQLNIISGREDVNDGQYSLNTFSVSNVDLDLRNKIRFEGISLTVNGAFNASAGNDFVLLNSYFDSNIQSDSSISAKNIYFDYFTYTQSGASAVFTFGDENTELIKMSNSINQGFEGDSENTKVQANDIILSEIHLNQGGVFEAENAIVMDGVYTAEEKGNYSLSAGNWIEIQNSRLQTYNLEISTTADGSIDKGIINISNASVTASKELSMLANEINVDNSSYTIDNEPAIEAENLTIEAKNNINLTNFETSYTGSVIALTAGGKLTLKDSEFSTYNTLDIDASYVDFNNVYFDNNSFKTTNDGDTYNPVVTFGESIVQGAFENVRFRVVDESKIIGLDEVELTQDNNNISVSWGTGGLDQDTSFAYQSSTWSDGTYDFAKLEWTGATNSDTAHITIGNSGSEGGESAQWKEPTTDITDIINGGAPSSDVDLSRGDYVNDTSDSISVEPVSKDEIKPIEIDANTDEEYQAIFDANIDSGDFTDLVEGISNKPDISHNDEITVDENFHSLNLNDELGMQDYETEVVLSAEDFDAAVLEMILNDITNEFYELEITQLAQALQYVKIGDWIKLSELFGFDEEKSESLKQSFEFLSAFYGENGAGALLEGFEGDLKTFDDRYKVFETIRDNVSEITFGKDTDAENNNQSIVGKYEKFENDYASFNEDLKNFNQYIEDLKNDKYGSPGTSEYEDSYVIYENMRNDLLAQYEDLMALSNDILSSIQSVASISKGKFNIVYDNTNILSIGNITIATYEKESGESDDNPNSRLFAEDNIYDENEESSQNNKSGEIDETAAKQKMKICIVSDNAKAMNPCLAMGE